MNIFSNLVKSGQQERTRRHQPRGRARRCENGEACEAHARVCPENPVLPRRRIITPRYNGAQTRRTLDRRQWRSGTRKRRRRRGRRMRRMGACYNAASRGWHSETAEQDDRIMGVGGDDTVLEAHMPPYASSSSYLLYSVGARLLRVYADLGDSGTMVAERGVVGE